MKEHWDACQKGALEKLALAEHAENHHPITWEETTVVDQAMQEPEGAVANRRRQSTSGCPPPPPPFKQG